MPVGLHVQRTTIRTFHITAWHFGLRWDGISFGTGDIAGIKKGGWGARSASAWMTTSTHLTSCDAMISARSIRSSLRSIEESLSKIELVSAADDDLRETGREMQSVFCLAQEG